MGEPPGTLTDEEIETVWKAGPTPATSPSSHVTDDAADDTADTADPADTADDTADDADPADDTTDGT